MNGPVSPFFKHTNTPEIKQFKMSASVASADSSSSMLDQALALVSEMSFSDKLTFNAKFASLLAKETKGAGVVAKAAKKEKKEKDPSAPKRVAGAGQKAWFAYIEHCITTMPERFTEAPLRKEKLSVVKAIRAEDKEGYDAFVAKYKEDHPAAPSAAPSAAASASASAESDAESDAEAEAKPVQKKAPAKAPKVEAKAPKAPEAAAAAPSKPMTAAEKIAAIKAKRTAEAAKKPSAAKKVVQAQESDGSLGRISIDGQDYHRDTGMNGLWKVAEDGEGFGAWVGYYQPGNEEEPIRFTESPADE